MPSYLRTLYLIEAFVPTLVIALTFVLARKRALQAVTVLSLLAIAAGIVYMLLTVRIVVPIGPQDYSSQNVIQLTVIIYTAQDIAAVLVFAAWILCLHDAAQHQVWWWFGGLVLFGLVAFLARNPVLIFNSPIGSFATQPSLPLVLFITAIGYSLPIGTLIYSLRGRRQRRALPDGLTVSSLRATDNGPMPTPADDSAIS